MHGYRDAHEAAQLRAATLEARLKEKEAAVEAREAEIAELRRELKHKSSVRRRASWSSGAGAALIGSLLASLTGTAFLVVHLSEALMDLAEAQQARAAAEERREQERAARVAAETALGEMRSEAAARAVPPARRVPDAHPSPLVHDPQGDAGTLVAIAIGGSCAFAVDGLPHGEKSSIRIVLPIGQHVVSCTPASGATRTQTVDVAPNKPGIASFRIP